MTPRQPMPDRIKAVTIGAAELFGVDPAEMVDTRIVLAVSEARDAAWAHMRCLTMANGRPPSHEQIGRWFGRTRTSVLEGEQRYWKRERAA